MEISLPETVRPLLLTETPNGPQLWKQIIDQIPGAVVAGGAVRDWFLDVRPKDIDVFIYYEDIPEDFFHSQFQPLCGDTRDENSERGAEYAAMREIATVARAEIGGLQVDLVGLTQRFTAAQLLERFDFGVARSLYDGHMIWDAPQAQLDRQNKTVTLMLDDRPERAQARFERFNERMGGGWEFVK